MLAGLAAYVYSAIVRTAGGLRSPTPLGASDRSPRGATSMQRSRSCSLSRGWFGCGQSSDRARPPAAIRHVKRKASSRSEQPANGSRSAADTSEAKLRGIPEVIDTATMRLEGKVVRLFGVEWVRGGQAEELAGYLRGREVECELASTPDRYRCQVGGHDLSRAVLFNGGGRATGDAPPELVEAENNAKAARRGVWQR